MKGAIVILVFSILGCTTASNPTVVENTKFKLPVIINKVKMDTIRLFESKYIMSNYPELIGKYKLGDTIKFTGEKDYEKLSESDYLWEVRDPFDSDTLSSDGLQVISDYATSLAFEWYDQKKYLYYPVYIVNTTTEAKIFFGKNGHGYAIQEAIDTNDYSLWHPIESVGFDFCGNGRFRKKINPGEFLMFLLPKYNGSLQTLMRIRFKIGQNIFISKAFKGRIDSSQFKIAKEEWLDHRLKESNGFASNWLFFGATPQEIYKYEKE